MFGADHAHAAFLDRGGSGLDAQHAQHTDNLDYLFPHTHTAPLSNQRTPHMEDFILIAEFSEQEGPRPVIVIPKDGGKDFDQNEFCVKILAVDHQSSIVDGCEITEDAQVVMSDPDKNAHAFIHHIVLNDIQARGYVRPFCMTYVTQDSRKVMKCYEEISTQMKKIARLMKYGNRLVFMRDLEKHLEDLSYTKAHLLLSHNRTQVTPQAENDLFTALNNIRQSMEEVKDILENLKPFLMDNELEERFQMFERQVRTSQHQASDDTDTGSLKDFNDKDQHTDKELSGSFDDRMSPVFSLFSKSKDLKPKLLDVSSLRGKRRFDRSLRSLHELCSWGAKEGLQRLRTIREYLKRDLCCIQLDEMDTAILSPDCGVLSFGCNTIGANFLSTCGSKKDTCCLKRRMNYPDNITSLGSVESFKSLSSSFQSLLDDEVMYSANSSMKDVVSTSYGLERQSSSSDGYGTRGSSEVGPDEAGFIFEPDDIFSPDQSNHLDLSLTEKQSSLVQTYRQDSLTSTLKRDSLKSETLIKEENYKLRADSTLSEYDSIDIDRDLQCFAKGCRCEKNSKLVNNTQTNACGCNESSDKCAINDGVKSEPCKQDGAKLGAKQKGFSMIGNKLIDDCNSSGDSKCVHGCENSKKVLGIDTSQANAEEVEAETNKDISNTKKYSNAIDCISKDNNEIKGAVEDRAETVINVANNTENVECENQENKDTDNPDSLMSDSTNTVCDDMTVIQHTYSIVSGEVTALDRLTIDTTESSKTSIEQVNETIPNLIDNNREMDEACIRNSDDGNEQFENYDAHSMSLNSEYVSYKLDINKTADTITQPNSNNNTGLSQTENVETQNKESNSVIQSHDTPSLDKVPDMCATVGELDRTSSRRVSESDTSSLEHSSNRMFVNPHRNTEVQREITPYEEVVNRYSRKRWRLTQSVSHMSDMDTGAEGYLRQIFYQYNNLHHVVYSLLSGRPVVVIGTKKHEMLVRQFVQALSIFTPVIPGCDSVSHVCQIKQLKVAHVHKFCLRGIIKADRRPVEYLVPNSVRRYITLLDVDKLLVYCQPYQGSLLNFVCGIFNKKKTFKSEQAMLCYLQMCLEDISTKAFNFYHCVTAGDNVSDFSGIPVPRKCAMLEMSCDKYLNRSGVMNSDTRIIKHLAEIVKIQQIDEEFKSKFLTDSPVLPFSVNYQSLQTYRLQ